MQSITSGPVISGRVVSHAQSPTIAYRSAVEARLSAAARKAALVARQSPRIFALLALRSPVGLWRLIRALVEWVADVEGRAVRRSTSGLAASTSAEPAAFVAATRTHRETQVLRLKLAGAATLVATLAILAAATMLDTLAQIALIAASLAALGWHGRKADAPLVEHSHASTDAPIPDRRIVRASLSTLGVAELTRALKADPESVRFLAPVQRDGEGWRVDLELPGGVTAGEVVDRRDRLASGLRRPSATVWPEPVEGGHEGQLQIWVGDRPMSAATPVPWALAQRGGTNIFDAFPFGTDQRGRPVTLSLMFASMVIGAVPRMGKTAGLRLILLGAALDPRVELHIANLKGGSDLAPFEPIAHHILAGDDEQDMSAFLADLESVRARMRARYATLATLPREAAPDSKITDQLASDPRFDFAPIVVAIDECQVAFEHKTIGDDFTDVVTDLVKRGPAVGIMVIVATQRPDKSSLPPGIRSNAQMRWSLRLMDQVATDMVLGTGAYRAGYRPQLFSRTDLGVGWLIGETDKPTIVKAAYVDSPTADGIVERARADRAARGLLTGAAAGVEDVQDRPSLVALVETHWPRGKARATWDELADSLVAAGLDETPTTLSSACRSAGVESIQVNRTESGRRVNRRGAALVDVQAALARSRG